MSYPRCSQLKLTKYHIFIIIGSILPGQNPMVSPNTQQLNSQGNAQQSTSQQGPGSQQTQNNPNPNSRSSPGPSDENMKKALAALGLPAQPAQGNCNEKHKISMENLLFFLQFYCFKDN